MDGHALIVIDPALVRQSEGVRTMSADAAVRRGVTMSVVTFDEFFDNPDRVLAGTTALVLHARSQVPTEHAAFFCPTQVPAACAATLAIAAGCGRVTAVFPSSFEEEFPVLLSVHLLLAGVEGIFDIIDLTSHTCTDAMVDAGLTIEMARRPNQVDLDALHARIDAVKENVHPGWKLDDFKLDRLRRLAREHPELARTAADPAKKVANIKKNSRPLFNVLEREAGEAMGLKRRTTAQVALFDLRAFLAFDLHPKTLQGQARQLRV